ncbi:12134_t:CDS:10 [Funneliformis mosseae]|uniref:12134_t:CDS:1 n=1 Tax=Funneliformis mosseae TaxID=27381 RepID=A0A9N9B9U9_FUNMO|nr:12134_t:CDS:10 [Funneliformis mosseae]
MEEAMINAKVKTLYKRYEEINSTSLTCSELECFFFLNSIHNVPEEESAMYLFQTSNNLVLYLYMQSFVFLSEVLTLKIKKHPLKLKLMAMKIFETYIPVESSEQRREIDDDQMVADPNEMSLQDIFESEFHCSENMMLICEYLNKICSNDSLIDLRPNSIFTKQLPSNILVPYLEELDNRIEMIWNDKIDDLQCSDKNDHLMVSTIRILRKTLPIFIMAFSQGPNNPLLNLTALKRTHLNEFVQVSLWYISSINYEFGEITTNNDLQEYADGLGYLDGSVVNDKVKCGRRIPKPLAIFGGQSFLTRIHLQFMDYCGGGKFRLNEVDNANLPCDFTEMGDFVFFYECIIKWALLAREVKEAFEKTHANTQQSTIYPEAVLVNTRKENEKEEDKKKLKNKEPYSKNQESEASKTNSDRGFQGSEEQLTS